MNIALNAVAMIMTGLMISGPSLLTKKEAAFTTGMVSGADVDLGITILGIILIVFLAVDTVKHLIKLTKAASFHSPHI